MSTKFALPPFLLLLLGLWTSPSLNVILAQQPQGFTTESQPPKLVVAITVVPAVSWSPLALARVFCVSLPSRPG